MKKIFLIIFTIFLCQKAISQGRQFDYEGGGNRNFRKEIIPLASCDYTASADYLFINQQGTGQYFEIWGQFCDLTLASKPSWVIFNPDGTIGAQPNPNNEVRSGVLNFTEATIPIYQAGLASTYIQVIGTPRVFAYYEYNYSQILPVESNVNWTVSSTQTWLKADTTSNCFYNYFTDTYENCTRAISVYPISSNPDTTSRSAIVTLTDGTITYSITFTQGRSSSLIVTPLNWAAPNTGLFNTQSVSISSNAEYWSASSNSNWLTITNNEGNFASYSSGTGNSSRQIKALTNPTTSSRTGTITFSVYGVPSQVITVTEQAGTPSLSLSPTAYTSPASGQTKRIDVAANSVWTVSSNQSWAIREYPVDNIGSSYFNIRTTKNTTTSSRTATISVFVTGLPIQTVTVTQEAPNLAVSPTNHAIPPNGGVQTSTITSNTTWTAVSNQPWLSLSAGSGTGSSSVNMTAGINNTDSPRSAIVTVTASGLPAQTISINQTNVILTASPSIYTPIALGGTQMITVNSNSAWSVTSNSNWLTSSINSGSGNGSFNAIVSQNASQSSRSGIISISVENIIFRNIIVNQAAPTLSISPQSISAVALGETKTITLNTNSNWTGSSNQTWATISSNSGSGNGTFNIVIAANPTISIRTAIVSITVPGIPTQTINISQAAGAPTLSISPTSYNALGSAMTKTILVTSNAPWTISSNQSWLTSNISNGNGDDAFILTSATNPNTSTRNAIATVTVSGLTPQTVTVTQAAGPTLSISPTTWSAAKTGGTRVIAITTNSAWTATSNQTWVTLSASSGTGNSNNTLTASANGTISARTAIVTYLVTGLAPKTVSVSQAAGDPTLVVTPLTWNPTSAASNITINVTSNSTWTLTSSKPWMTTSITSGNGNGTFTINVTANTGVRRKAFVTVKINNQLLRDIDVNQNPNGSRLSAEIIDLSTSNEGNASIFPNPADNIITIKIPEINKLKGSLSFKTSLGKELYSYQKKDFDASGEVKIDISELPSGIYLIDYQYIDNRKKSLKLIKK